MINISIIHGWGADSLSNWFPWLKTTLEQEGIQATCLDFPHSQTPLLSEWLEFFKKNIQINEDTILVGHSLGVPFTLRLLETLAPDEKIKAAFLVAGFERLSGISEIDNFVEEPFDWEKIKNSCEDFVVINSTNDPFIPLFVGQSLAKSLGVELIVEENQGHIMNPDGDFGYRRLLDLLLKKV